MYHVSVCTEFLVEWNCWFELNKNFEAFKKNCFVMFYWLITCTYNPQVTNIIWTFFIHKYNTIIWSTYSYFGWNARIILCFKISSRHFYLREVYILTFMRHWSVANSRKCSSISNNRSCKSTSEERNASTGMFWCWFWNKTFPTLSYFSSERFCHVI